MSPSIFLPVVRELVRSYQAFELVSARHIRQLGLTPPQFDIIATLGNTQGMNCKELGEKTLITKGTLTGVLDRLIDKGLICRSTPPEDRRSIFICLTDAGEALFDGKTLAQTVIGYVFQNYREAMFPWMRTIDNIAYPLKLEGPTRYESERTASN